MWREAVLRIRIRTFLVLLVLDPYPYPIKSSRSESDQIVPIRILPKYVFKQEKIL